MQVGNEKTGTTHRSNHDTTPHVQYQPSTPEEKAPEPNSAAQTDTKTQFSRKEHQARKGEKKKLPVVFPWRYSAFFARECLLSVVFG